MTRGTLFAVLFLAAYLAFEAYAIRKASHRTEPAYIYKLLIEARTATQLCQSDALQLQTRFARTLERVSGSYQRDIEENNRNLSPSDVDQQLAQLSAEAQNRITESITANGCENAEAKAHFQRYRIYAGKTR